MPKRKSRNQSLKQRVKALEMRLGMQAFGLNSRRGIKTDGAGRVSGFGLHSPDVAPAGFHLQATDVEVDGVKVPKGAYMDASEINRVSTQWARFETIAE